MNDEQRQVLNATSIIPLPGNRYTRRQTVAMLGGLGVAAAAFPALSQRAVAEEHHATPDASPVAGPRDDGTNLWKVQVGGMDMENQIDLHAFFPEEVTINAGDAVHFAFAPMGMPQFHTVTFLSGEELPPLLTPNVVDGTPVASPEGPPQLILNPLVAWTDGRTDYDGTGYANSGLDVFRLEDGPYILTFTTPGTFEYECAVHGIVMKGTVVVQEAGAELPNDVAAYEAMSADQMAAVIEEGMASVAELEGTTATPAAGSGTWDVTAGAGGLSKARVMRFIPEDLTIKVGDMVRWTNRSDGEPHTVTFLGNEEPPEDVLIEPQASGQPKFVQNMKTFLPSGGPEHDGTAFANSGFTGFPPEVNELFGLVGPTWELTFTAAGEYPYYCVLHSGGPDAEGGMNGTIIVEA